MKRSAVLLATVLAAGCAHQGGSARHESGSASSSSAQVETRASDQYYGTTTWRDMEIDAPAPDPNIASPTAADYLRGIEMAQDEATVAEQLDPGSRVNVNVRGNGRDIDASASAATGIGAAAEAESGTASSSTTVVTSESQSDSSDLATSSDELPGAEARQRDIPAALAPFKDNHPDLTDDPNFPEAYTPEAVGGAASAESGSSSSSAVDVQDNNLSNDDLQENTAPVDQTLDRDESDFSAPLGGGTPSDGSSSEINSGTSIDRTSPEAGAISTPLGTVTSAEKDVSVSSSSANDDASGAPAGAQSGGGSSAIELNPDKDLGDKVYRQLQSNPPGSLTQDNLRDIKISAKDGVVSLNGSVNNESEKGLIEQRVQRMPDVKSVSNNLSVGNGQPDNAPEPDASLENK